jgi:hypothetical protein
MLFSFLLTSVALFYTPHNYGFIPSHTTVCPSVKYYSTFEEILNPVPTIANKSDLAKQKKKSTRLSKHKKRMIAEKNKEKAYLANLIRQKDGDYATYITEVIDFYNSKLKNVYIDYMSNTKNMDNLEHYVIVLNDALDDEEMLMLKNKKHHYVVKHLSILIEGFERLIECKGIGDYELLSVEMMSKLHDIIHQL